MSMNRLPIALRAYTERTDRPHRAGSPFPWRGWPKQILVFDTETTVDGLQRLTFGSYRYLEVGSDGKPALVEEGLFHDDDLAHSDPEGFRVLTAYVKRHKELKLFSRSGFLDEVFYRVAYQTRALVVGFNLPFDLTRLATSWGEGRGKFYGGFSLVLWEAWDANKQECIEDRWRPRLLMNLLDSKRAFIEFATPLALDPQDADVIEGEAGKKTKWAFRGNFLDLRTLAYAQTGESYSLASACKAFGVRHGKGIAKEHGRITKEYIDYNRRDVLATCELLIRLADEFEVHPIGLNPCKAFSPASIGKAYMRSLGVMSPFQKFADLPREVDGIAMSAYYGGRAECHIRKTPVPVVHTDFISMYPTVFALLGLWDLVTAQSLVIEECTAEAQAQLSAATAETYFTSENWGQLNWFGEIEPSGDIVPVRAQYDPANPALNIAVNTLTSSQPFWFAGPDLVASSLLARNPPRLKRAIRLVPKGKQEGLKEVLFSGTLPIDPAGSDFIKTLIEQRKRIQKGGLAREDRERIARALKLVANSTSYGIFAEINQERLPKDSEADVRVYAAGSSFDATSRTPESPGEFCRPPFAALITAAARLMLALLERSVTDMGGTFAFCDTDSMAIVATKRGGLVPVTGGPARNRRGKRGVKALSWTQVSEIVEKFADLNPYDPSAVRGSVLEIKDVNFGKGGKQLPLYVYVIASKRYTFFRKRGKSKLQIIEPSEHGLGHLLNPMPDSEPGLWIELLWRSIVANELGIPVPKIPFLDLPALTRITVSSPHILRPFMAAQIELPFKERTSPTIFMLSASVAPNGHPVGADPLRFHLVSPYQPDSSRWLATNWTDLHSGHQYQASTSYPAHPYMAQIRSYRDVLSEYVAHPEPKSATTKGEPCGRKTRGLLERRRVGAQSIVCVGKETNRLESVQQGLVHDWGEVYSIYHNPELDPWRTEILSILKTIPAQILAELAHVSTRTIRSIRNGHSVPSPKTRALLVEIAINAQKITPKQRHNNTSATQNNVPNTAKTPRTTKKRRVATKRHIVNA